MNTAEKLEPNFSKEFMRGQRDCKDGKPHKPGQTEAYDRGYGAQYEAEQQLTEMGIRRGY